MRSRVCNNDGISLLEVLATSAVLIVLVNLVTGIMMSGNRLSAAGVAAVDRIQRSTDIREAFLRDVKTSYGVAASALSYATSDSQLVLELPPPVEYAGAKRFAVYGLLKSNKQLDRMEFTVRDGEPVVESFETFPLPLEGFRVSHAGRLVSVELDADQTGNRPVPPGAKRKPPVTYRFTAASRSVSGGQAS